MTTLTRRATTRTLNFTTLLIVWFFVAYIIFQFLPAQAIWLRPGPIAVQQSPDGLVVTLTPTIHRETRVARYSVVYDALLGTVACEGGTGPRNLQPTNGKTLTQVPLVTWIPNDFRCAILGDGLYWMETCFRLADPLHDLIPALPYEILGVLTPRKTICTETPTFVIGNPVVQQQTVAPAMK